MGSTWAIGVCVNIVGSIMINLGTNLLKYSHKIAQDEYLVQSNQANLDRRGNGVSEASITIADAGKSNVKHISGTYTKLWYIAFSTFVLGNLINFGSFSLATQSLLAGLGSIQFITNVIFSRFLFNDQITAQILLGTLIILSGNVFVVIFANQSSNNYTAQQLLELYGEPTFLWYAGFMILLAIFLHRAHLESIDLLHRAKVLQYRLLNPKRLNPMVEKAVPITFALVSGIIGTQGVVLAKSCSDLIRSTFQGENQFVHPFTYVLLAIWVYVITFWLRRMNEALRRFDGVFIIPLLQVNWIVFSIISGGIYFQEFEGFSSGRLFGFLAGVVLIVIGVFLLAPEKLQKEKVEDVPRRSKMLQSKFSRTSSWVPGISIPMPDRDSIGSIEPMHRLSRMPSYNHGSSDTDESDEAEPSEV